MKRTNTHSKQRPLRSIRTYRHLFALAIALLALLPTNFILAQQVIGSFPYMNGGFEGQAAGALGTTVSPTLWSRQSQTGSSTTISTSSPRTGLSYATVTANAATSRNLQSPQLMPFSAGSTLIASTSYTVQYWIKNAATVAAFQVGPTTNGTGNPTYSTAATMAINAGWTKYTNTLSTQSTTVASSGIAVIGRATIGTFDIDDVVIYAGAADASAPNAPTSPAISAVGATQQTISWTAASGGTDGGGYMIVRGTSDPTTTPNANGIYAVGNTVATDQKVVYLGTNNTFIDVELNPSTTYYYRIYTVDKAFNYSTAATVNGATTTASYSSEPTVQASAVNFTSVSSTGMTINWTPGNGTNSLVVIRSVKAIDSDPSDGSTYTPNTVYGSGSQIGLGNGGVVSMLPSLYATQYSSNYSVYNGSGNSVTVTGLSKGTTYYVKVYSYNGASGSENYLTSNPASSSQDIGNIITSAQSGPWGTTTTWTGGVVPTILDNVVIQNGHTVDMLTSNAPVFSVTINSGGKLYSSTSTSTWNLQVYGSKLQCDGTLGDPSNTASYIFIDFANNLTISGAGTINIYKIRPVSGYSNIGVTFASNTNITYATASIVSDNTNNNNVTYTVNPNVTLGIAGNMNTTSSINTYGTANTTWNINGTVNALAGSFSPVVTSSNSYTCNIGNAGSLTVQTLVVAQNGASPTINIANGGQFTVTNTCDLTGSAPIIIQGEGTFATGSGSTVKISNASGLNSSTGPIRTSSVSFNAATNFSFTSYSTTQNTSTTINSTTATLSAANGNISVGMGVSGTGIAPGTTVAAVSGTALTLSQNATATGSAVSFSYYVTTLPAQTTGNIFPSTINALTINNASGVTMSGSTTVNGACNLTAGALAIGANTLTLKGTSPVVSGSINGASGTIIYNGASGQTANGLTNVNNLTTNNSIGVTLGAATTVNGVLTLTAGPFTTTTGLTLGNSASIVRTAGSLSATPTFGTAVNLTYNGASAQTTSNELPTSSSVLNNLTINNAAGVSLNANSTVNGTLTLSSGTLSLGSKNLTIGASGSISGASSSNYIVTDGVGTLTQTVGAATPVLFPIGASATSSYDPATVTPTTGTTIAASVSGSLAYHNQSVPNPVYLNPREWTITPTAASSTVLALTPSATHMYYPGGFNAISGGSQGYDNVEGNYYFSSASRSGTTFTATYSDFTNPFVTATTDVAVTAKEITAKSGIYAANGQIFVENAAGKVINVYSIAGSKVRCLKNNTEKAIIPIEKGIYIISVDNVKSKVLVK